MHQRVLGTLANLALLAAAAPNVASFGMPDGHETARQKLKQLLNDFLRGWGGAGRLNEDLRASFSLEALERTDKQLQFPAVRFEAARFLWCMVRLRICHGESVRRFSVRCVLVRMTLTLPTARCDN